MYGTACVKCMLLRAQPPSCGFEVSLPSSHHVVFVRWEYKRIHTTLITDTRVEWPLALAFETSGLQLRVACGISSSRHLDTMKRAAQTVARHAQRSSVFVMK